MFVGAGEVVAVFVGVVVWAFEACPKTTDVPANISARQQTSAKDRDVLIS